MEFNVKKYNTQISQNQLLSSFASSSRDINVDTAIAAELAQVYPAVQHGHSYRSLYCGIKLNSSIYSDSEISKKHLVAAPSQNQF
jgi:hypothetical protein